MSKQPGNDKNDLAGAGGARNLVWHGAKVNADDRTRVFGQHPATVWITGLSAAGKSTIAYEMERRLLGLGKVVYVLDGDNIRHGLSRDLDFSPAGRCENIRRIAEVARLMNDAGLIVVCAFISPYREDRRNARAIIGDERFVEVHLSTSLQVCEGRDPKGMYKRARSGEIPEFTGVTAPYETPEKPRITIDTAALDLEQSVTILMDYLADRYISPPV
jgi:adenylylsulfate kinase